MGRFANKIVVIYLILPVIFSGIFFIYTVYAGTLVCTVRASACVGDEVDIFEMQALSNSHAGSPASYTKLVCCGGVTGLGTSCFGTFDTVLKLSDMTNAHVQQTGIYDNSVCMSVPSGGTVNIDYQASNCSGFDDTLASMSDTTNAHVGDEFAYTTKICGTATGAGAQTLSFSLGSNSLNLGTLSSSAVTTGSHTMNVATNASSGMVVTVSGTTLTSGGNTVSACAANCTNAGGAGQGTEQFGINLKDNTSPNVGLEASGSAPIGEAAVNYNTVDSFRFVTGDTIAISSIAINDTTFTISYIANISGSTEAGSYTTTLTYIATATF